MSRSRNRYRFAFSWFALSAAFIVLARTTGAAANDWPQWLGAERDGIWRETGIADKFPKEGPRIVWRVPIGSGYSGPAVACS